MKCPSCGEIAAGRARFCQYCGAALHTDGADAPPPVRARTSQTSSPISRSQSRSQTQSQSRSRATGDAGTLPPLRKRGCGFGSVLLALLLLIGGGAAWFFTQQFRLERAAFERVRHSNSIAELEQYLGTRMYMPEEHRRVAEARIARLLSDSADFANATTVETCERYLTAHSDGAHVDEVQSRLARLRRERPAAALMTEPRKEAVDTVRREADVPEKSVLAVAANAEAAARYHVVAASLANYDAATARVAELRSKGYSAYVMEALTDEGRVFRVVVASYSDPESARRTAESVRKECPGAWVLAK